MIRRLLTPTLAILLSGLVMTGALAWLVIDRIALLSSGREIVLAIRPVDPRDLFKGDYVRLAFDVSEIDKALLPDDKRQRGERRFGPGATIPLYVVLERQPDETWLPVAVSETEPTGLPANRIFLKGKTQWHSRRRVLYGIERYYVEEGTGLALENLARTAKLAAIVAVGRDGTTAIKGLVVDGRRVYDEPLL
jgi:uncharacterized membrane-anchored protein